MHITIHTSNIQHHKQKYESYIKHKQSIITTDIVISYSTTIHTKSAFIIQYNTYQTHANNQHTIPLNAPNINTIQSTTITQRTYNNKYNTADNKQHILKEIHIDDTTHNIIYIHNNKTKQRHTHTHGPINNSKRQHKPKHNTTNNTTDITHNHVNIHNI